MPLAPPSAFVLLLPTAGGKGPWGAWSRSPCCVPGYTQQWGLGGHLQMMGLPNPVQRLKPALGIWREKRQAEPGTDAGTVDCKNRSSCQLLLTTAKDLSSSSASTNSYGVCLRAALYTVELLALSPAWLTCLSLLLHHLNVSYIFVVDWLVIGWMSKCLR